MADTSKRIIILSALILVVIIIWFPNSGQMRTIVTINDVEVEIETPRDSYTLGENFTATVHIVNNGSKDIWMNPIIELAFLGSSLYDPEPNTGVILLDWGQGAMIHIPAKSKITLFERDFESRYSGEFLITCFGAEKTVLILEQDYTWITATVLTVEHSPNLDVVEISSEDKDIPLSLFVAIDKALLEEVSVQEGGTIRDLNDGRRLPISSADAESIIHYFGGEMEKDRLNYEFYVSYVDYTFSILIQYSLPDITD